MTIHHDKLAYGKLAPVSENLSEDRIAQLLAELNGADQNGNTGNAENCFNVIASKTAETGLNGAYTAPDSTEQHKK